MNLNFFPVVNDAPFAYLGIKGGIIVLLIMYVLFSLIVLRQVTIMMQIVEVPINPIFRMIIILHAVLALVVLLFAFFII